MRLREDTGNGFVVSTCVEFALIVATTDMDAEGDAGMPIDDSIVHLDAGIDQFVGVAAALAIALSHFGIEQGRVLGRVNLDVGAAQTNQLLRHRDARSLRYRQGRRHELRMLPSIFQDHNRLPLAGR